MKAVFVLPLLFLGAAGNTPIALAQSPGTFTATGNMTTPRSEHTATLLTNGTVLITGGFGGDSHPYSALASAELYDPSTGAFTATGNMTTPRFWHTATLLPDGRVLIAGGATIAYARTNSAEIYDPSTGTFAATGNTISGHRCSEAILLGNGKVFIAGGSTDAATDFRSPDAELYDPTTGTFAATGAYNGNTGGFNTCQGAVSTLLPDGRVLLIWEEGGAEVFDPDAGLFTMTASPILGFYDMGLPTATLLMNGKVLVAGGGDDGGPRTAAELYDFWTGTFTAAKKMITGHSEPTATLLPDGTVLIAGTFLGPVTLDKAELYDPGIGAFSATGDLPAAGFPGHTATLLPSGEVLVAGGIEALVAGGDTSYASTSNAEIYHPVVLVSAPQLFSVSGNGSGQGAIWHATTGEIASPDNPAVAGEPLSMYTTTLADGGLIPPQVAVGGQLAEVLDFGAASGYPGYNQVNVRVPSGIAPGPAVSVRLIYLSRPSNEVTIAVR